MALTSLIAPTAFAQTTTVYSNTTNFQGIGYTGGLATGTGPTTLVADDITPIAGFAGSEVTTFTFSVMNFNSTASTFTPTVDFFKANGLGYVPGAGGPPGTLLASLQLNPLTVAGGGTIQLFTATSATGFFALPTGTFWASESFSGAPAAMLNNLGQGLYSPPTVGSSQNLIFQSTGPETGSSSPPGNTETFVGGPEVASFGWSFGVATPAAVPEASTTVSFGLLLALGLGGAVLARKKAAASA